MDSPADCNPNPGRTGASPVPSGAPPGARDIIQDEISRLGPIPFARFMELALYHPTHGYYRHSTIGRRGDFYTSVSVGPLFGQMLAFFLARELEKIPGPLQIVEAGANDGSLARDILDWVAANRPAFSRRVTYQIVEPLANLEMLQREKLKGRPVQWLAQIPEIRGALICNELLDAFPVHIFQWNLEWSEMGVDTQFQWARLPMPQWAQMDEFRVMESQLPPNFTTEESPAAEAWWQYAARNLSAGLLLAIDYGSAANPLRSTVRAYRKHRLVSDVLAHPGEQDITASVNFARLRRAGDQARLVSRPLQTQAKFLSSLAGDFFEKGVRDVRQFQTLTHPEHLGRAFKVLVQSTSSS